MPGRSTSMRPTTVPRVSANVPAAAAASASANARTRASRGETITEVLVSILIAGLAALLLSVVVTAAVNINQASRVAMDEYYAAGNALASTGGSYTDGQGTVTLRAQAAPGETGEAVKLQSGASAVESLAVEYAVGEQSADDPVVAYKEQSSP